MSDMKKYLAEFLGTFVLVFIGTGSAVVAGKEIGVLGIALAFGLSVLVMVYAIGKISGCHINPAITIAMLLNGKIPSKDAIIYIIVQCTGAIIASALLLAIMTGLTRVSGRTRKPWSKRLRDRLPWGIFPDISFYRGGCYYLYFPDGHFWGYQ